MHTRSLNLRQAQFARLVAGGMNATEAYIRSYPGNYSRSSAATKAHKLKRHPLIAAQLAKQAETAIAAVDAATERDQITAERVADAMARLAFTDLRQVADVRTVLVNGKLRQEAVLKDFDAIDDGAHAAISEIKRAPSGELTVRLYNKREALIDLARLKGWIGDKPIDNRNLVVLKVER